MSTAIVVQYNYVFVFLGSDIIAIRDTQQYGMISFSLEVSFVGDEMYG